MTAPKTALEKKPVTAGERRALEKLLEEDFAILRIDLNNMAVEERIRRETELRATATRKTERAREFEDLFIALIREVEDAGFRVVNRDYHHCKATFKVEDNLLDEAIAAAMSEINGDLNQATAIVRRKEHEAKRAMLSATLNGHAVEVLRSMPKADDVMSEAIARRPLALEGSL